MKLIIHQEAQEEFYQIIKYCSNQFGNKTAHKVRNKYLDVLKLLMSNPNMGHLEKFLYDDSEKPIRSISMQQTKIVYVVFVEYIYVIMFWNNIKNPNNFIKGLNRLNQ